MPGTKLVVQYGDYHGFPEFCAACLSTADLDHTEVRSPFSFASQRFVAMVPMCRHCATHFRWTTRAVRLAAFLVALAPIYWIERYQLPRNWRDFFVFVAAVVAYVGDPLKGPVRVNAKHGGRLVFWFSNHDYARLFELRNQCSYDSASNATVL